MVCLRYFFCLYLLDFKKCNCFTQKDFGCFKVDTRFCDMNMNESSQEFLIYYRNSEESVKYKKSKVLLKIITVKPKRTRQDRPPSLFYFYCDF